MTRAHAYLAILAALGCFAAAFLAPGPGRAQEANCQVTPEGLRDYLATSGGEMIGGIVYDGVFADMTVFYTLEGIVLFMSFDDGCAIAPAARLDMLRTSPEPAPEPAPGALRNPKAETPA